VNSHPSRDNREVTETGSLACPRCRIDLGAEIIGPISAHRCAGCGGLWLDPETFRALCDVDAGKSAPRALARREPTDAGRPTRDERVHYLPCPVCGEMMSRVNFARVSGVVLDVCRSHGAWFDAGELLEVRRFVRGHGLLRYLRRRSLDAALRGAGKASGRTEPGSDGSSSSLDLLDVLAGIPDRWDIPRPRSPVSQLLRALVFASAGGLLLWWAFSGSSLWRLRWGGTVAAVVAAVLLLAAFRALGDAIDRWRARRSDEAVQPRDGI
jgi:Zn-finger nucleic acid-binding protein